MSLVWVWCATGLPGALYITTVLWLHGATVELLLYVHRNRRFIKPVLNWANVCSPNILRTVRRSMIRFLIELLVRRTWFGRFDELYFKSSVYFNHPSQGNSTNYYLILGPRDKAAPPTSQQINKFPQKRMKNLATPSSIFIFISSSSTGELCSQPIRGNVRRIGRMFPEHVEWSFLDPEYSFVAVRRILPTRFAKKSSPN